MGAGHLNPNPAVDPGLVYDAGFFEYLGFLCGSTNGVSPDTCEVLASLDIPFDASNLNLPSIGIADLAGFQTVVRSVKNVGSAGTYNVSIENPAGIDVAVSPASLTLEVDASASYSVTFTTLPGATLDAWTFGSLTWSDGSHNVRSPIAIKPVALASPAEVAGAGVEDSLEFDVTFGYTGVYAAAPLGLEPADMQADNVVDDPANDINTALGTGVGVTFHYVTVPTDTVYARFSLFDEYTDGADDLDLYVFGPDTAGFPQVGASGSGTSAEEVNLIDPVPGLYIAVVHGWQTDGSDANYTLFGWAFGPDASNMTITAPAAATLGATETVTVDWTGLSSDTKYLGAVSHSDGSGSLGMTLVGISTD
jgi:hypothetical protein